MICGNYKLDDIKETELNAKKNEKIDVCDSYV